MLSAPPSIARWRSKSSVRPRPEWQTAEPVPLRRHCWPLARRGTEPGSIGWLDPCSGVARGGRQHQPAERRVFRAYVVPTERYCGLSYVT